MKVIENDDDNNYLGFISFIPRSYVCTLHDMPLFFGFLGLLAKLAIRTQKKSSKGCSDA